MTLPVRYFEPVWWYSNAELTAITGLSAADIAAMTDEQLAAIAAGSDPRGGG